MTRKGTRRRVGLNRGNIIAIILMIGAMLALFAAVVGNNALNLAYTGVTENNRQQARYAAYAGLEWALAEIIHDGQAPPPFTFQMPSQNIYVMVNVGTVVPNQECLITSRAYNGNTTQILEGLAGLQGTAQRPPLTLNHASVTFTNTTLTGTTYCRDFDFEGTANPAEAYQGLYRQDETYSNIYSSATTGYQGEQCQLATGTGFYMSGAATINGSGQGPDAYPGPDFSVPSNAISGGFGPLTTALPVRPNVQLPVADPAPYAVLTGPNLGVVNDSSIYTTQTTVTMQGSPPVPVVTTTYSPVTLSPGNYTSIDVDKQVYANCEIRLQGGTLGTTGSPSFYQFQSGIDVSNANIVIDTQGGHTGPVVVYAGSHVNTSNCFVNSDNWNEVPANFQLNMLDPTPVPLQTMYYRSATQIPEGTAADLYTTSVTMGNTVACMVAVGGNMTLEATSGSRLLGAVEGDNVTLSGSSIEYDSNLASTHLYQMGPWTLVGVMSCGF